MGRTTQQEAYRDDPDAVSMHTTPDDYTYDDAPEISGLPPSYTDSETESVSAAMSPTAPHIHHIAPPTTRTDHNNVTLKNGVPVVCDTRTIMEAALDTDPFGLEETIRALGNTIPAQFVYIMGSHRETVKKGDKKETRDVIDFRVVINIRHHLLNKSNAPEFSSERLVTVENGEKTHRGTIFKCRAPGAKQDIEVGVDKPTLREWCHRYCASPRKLRIFRLRHVVTGFDDNALRQRLEGLVRSTNYRGNVSITFPIEDTNVDIYTGNWINKWRLTNWICWIFYLTFLWIFTWPYLFFMTKRYAVVRAEWPFSVTGRDGRKTYATISEDQWFEKWHVAIRRLVLDQYQGEAHETMMASVIARPEDPPMPGSGISTGHAGVDNAVGILTQGFQIARAVSNGSIPRAPQGGWGHNS